MPHLYPYNGNPLFPRYDPLNRCHLHITDAQLTGKNNLLIPIKKGIALFHTRPTLSNIEQGEVANCYFAATLLALLNHHHGANYVTNIMAVTQINLQPKIGVRFYVYNNFLEQFEPFYIYFDRSIFCYQQDRHATIKDFNASFPWVNYLNKAYYIFKKFICPDITKLKKKPDTYEKFESALAGGKSEEIFTLLLGVTTEKVILSNGFTDYTKLPLGIKPYSTEENQLFQQLQTHLNNNVLLCVGSKDEQEGHIDAHGGYQGILPQHGYAVIGYREGNVVLPDNRERTLKFLILKNPWGKYTKSYRWVKIEDEFYGKPYFILRCNAANQNGFDYSYSYFGNLHFSSISAEKLPNPLIVGLPTGVFAIELTDFSNCFAQLCSATGTKLDTCLNILFG